MLLLLGKMNIQIIIFAIFCSLILRCNSIPRRGSCPIPNDWYKQKIDDKKIAGRWYQIVEAKDDDEDLERRCMLFDVIPGIANLGQTWIEVGLTKVFNNFEPYSKQWPNRYINNDIGTWTSREVSVDAPIGKDFRKVWLLAADYNRYLVAYTCREDIPSGTYYASIWVTSRGLTLCDEYWAIILDALSKSGIANKLSSFVTLIDQSNCPHQDLELEKNRLVAQFLSNSVL